MCCSKCGVQNSDGVTHCVNCGSVLMDVSSLQGVGNQPSSFPASPPKTYGLAVAAFIMGLLCMTCFLWPLLTLPAIICAIIALIKIGCSNGQLKGTGFAIAGLVIPVVMTIILPLFLAIIIPAFSKARDMAETTVCVTNLRTLVKGMMIYNDEYNAFPPPERWCDALIEEQGISPNILHCPEDPENAFSYAVNRSVYATEQTQLDPQMVLLFEANIGPNGIGGAEDVVFRHTQGGRAGCNMAFMDGHVEFVTEDRIANLKWTVE